MDSPISPSIEKLLNDLEFDREFIDDYDVLRAIRKQTNQYNTTLLIERFLGILDRRPGYQIFITVIEMLLINRFDASQFIRLIKVAIISDLNIDNRPSKESWQAEIARVMWFKCNEIAIDTMRIAQSLYIQNASFPFCRDNYYLQHLTRVNALPAILKIPNQNERSDVLRDYLQQHKIGDMPRVLKTSAVYNTLMKLAYPDVCGASQSLASIWPERGLTKIVIGYLKTEPITLENIIRRLTKV